MPERVRRWNGWGFTDEAFPVSAELGAWLERRVGRGEPLRSVAESAIPIPAPATLPDLPCEVAVDGATRLRNAVGMSFPDLVALRRGQLALPDAVALPGSAAEVAGVLAVAAARGVAVVVRGGGSSVVGGVTVPGGRTTVVLSLERLQGLVGLDATSQLATFRAGTYGPRASSLLAGHGLRLGHEPQSFEHSTVGGWVAARSAGQRSTGIGKIEDLVAGLEIATFDGLWRLAARPAGATGPDLRQAVIGSEGRLGVITEAVLRVRRIPEVEVGSTIWMRNWSLGLEVARRLLQEANPVEVLRLSDATESEMALEVLHLPGAARRALRWLASRPGRRSGCLLLLAWSGDRSGVMAAHRQARQVWRDAGGVALGGHGYRSWLRDRFRHPYLRDALLDAGWGIDTLETAAPWSRLQGVVDAVRAAFAGVSCPPCVSFCHLSHAYRDGASLYFTFLWPLREGEETGHWLRLKSAATDALWAAGGTLSHHHGIGSMHARWLGNEVGPIGHRLLRAMTRSIDPRSLLNPGTLLEDEPC